MNLISTIPLIQVHKKRTGEGRPKRTSGLKKRKPNDCSKLKITNLSKWTRQKHFCVVVSMTICFVVETLMLFSMSQLFLWRKGEWSEQTLVNVVLTMDVLPPSPLFSHPRRHRELQTVQWAFQGSLWFLPCPCQYLWQNISRGALCCLGLGQWQCLCCSLALCFHSGALEFLRIFLKLWSVFITTDNTFLL